MTIAESKNDVPYQANCLPLHILEYATSFT